MRKTILTLMIGGLLASGTALAGGQGQDHGAEARGQAHSQSRLSIGSVRTMGSATAFAKVDANGDNMITQGEAEAMQGLPQQFGRLDGNGDRQLTMQEFASLTAGSSGDRGHSGAEVAVDAEAGIGLGVNTGSDRPEGEGRGNANARAEAESEATARLKVEDISRMNAVQAFNNVDADGNFKLDKSEAASIQGLKQKFADLDKDGDGALDYAEFNAVTGINAEGRLR